MRDLIFIAYAALWIAAAWSIKRVPFWQPRVVRLGDASFIPDQRPAGCMMLFCLAMGAVIGLGLPLTLSGILPRNPYQFSNGGTQDLDAIGRLAMIVGGVCGGYVGFRGSQLWVVLLVAGMGVYVVASSVGWMFRGF